MSQRLLEQGRIKVIGLSSGTSVCFFITQIAAMCRYQSYEYLVVLSQLVQCQHCVKSSFGLNFGVVKSQNCSLAVAIYDNMFVLGFSEYKVGCCSCHCKNCSLKHSRIGAKVNGFFGHVIMAVLDRHTCSSPVVIKLGAICVAVDVVSIGSTWL